MFMMSLLHGSAYDPMSAQSAAFSGPAGRQYRPVQLHRMLSVEHARAFHRCGGAGSRLRVVPKTPRPICRASDQGGVKGTELVINTHIGVISVPNEVRGNAMYV